jgi:hypothetical protein
MAKNNGFQIIAGGDEAGRGRGLARYRRPFVILDENGKSPGLMIPRS